MCGGGTHAHVQLSVRDLEVHWVSGSQKLTWVSSFFSLNFIFWRQDLSLNVELTYSVTGLLAVKPLGPACLNTTRADITGGACCIATWYLCGCLGVWVQVLIMYRKHFTHWAISLQPRHFFFIVWVFCLRVCLGINSCLVVTKARKKGVRWPGIGVTDSCGPFVFTGNWT